MPQSEYRTGCTLPEWYRSSETSIMRDKYGTTFNDISRKYIYDAIIQVSTGGKVPTGRVPGSGPGFIGQEFCGTCKYDSPIPNCTTVTGYCEKNNAINCPVANSTCDDARVKVRFFNEDGFTP